MKNSHFGQTACKKHYNNLCNRFGTWKKSASESMPFQSRNSRRARREERLTHSKLKQAFIIDSDADLFMYLMQCTRFGLWTGPNLARRGHYRHHIHSQAKNRGEQLPRTCVTAFSPTSLFLERYWREFRDIFKTQYITSQQNFKSWKCCFFPFNVVPFSFVISYTSNAPINGAELPFSPEILRRCI